MNLSIVVSHFIVVHFWFSAGRSNSRNCSNSWLNDMRWYGDRPYRMTASLCSRVGYPLFFLPVVDRIFLGDPHHVVVAVGFGQYRGRSDRNAYVASPLTMQRVRNVERCPEPDFRRSAATAVSTDSRSTARDIAANEAFRMLIRSISSGQYHLYGPGYGFPFDNVSRKQVAVFLAHLFRVVQQRMVPFRAAG